jgi:hypothetical protein
MPIPVPPVPPGYRLGSGDAPMQVEAFLDVECPFSKNGSWVSLPFELTAQLKTQNSKFVT